MKFLDLTNPIILLLAVIAVALVIFLGQEVKKSTVTIIPLFAFLASLIIHLVQVLGISPEYSNLISTIYRCMAIDFGFILVTFFAYLWVDDIEAKKNNKKSIDNSLDWFWKEL